MPLFSFRDPNVPQIVDLAFEMQWKGLFGAVQMVISAFERVETVKRLLVA